MDHERCEGGIECAPHDRRARLSRLLFVLAVYILLLPQLLSAQPFDLNRVRSAVVRVVADHGSVIGSGSVVALSGRRAYILTAYHVIRNDWERGNTRLKLELSPEGTAEAISSKDRIAVQDDLAVLVADNLPAPGPSQISWGSSAAVRETDRVWAIGHPIGGPGWVVSEGTVGRRTGGKIYFSGTAVNPGNSGGPLVDAQGRLVGLIPEISGSLGAALEADMIWPVIRDWLPAGVSPTPSPTVAATQPQPAFDFPGGSKRIYSADFSTWPKHETDAGSVKLGFGNSYILEPSSNTWIGPGRSIDISPIENDFVFDVRFQVERRSPSAALTFGLTGGGTDAEAVDVFFEVWDEGNVTYSLSKGRVRSGGALAVPHGITEETIAERERLPSALQNQDWSKGGKLTLKREGGRMQFFVNESFVKEFSVSRFPVTKIGLGAAFKSRVVVTSIEARVKD